MVEGTSYGYDYANNYHAKYQIWTSRAKID